MWHVYLITKLYHYVRENTAYSKDFIQAIYGIYIKKHVQNTPRDWAACGYTKTNLGRSWYWSVVDPISDHSYIAAIL